MSVELLPATSVAWAQWMPRCIDVLARSDVRFLPHLLGYSLNLLLHRRGTLSIRGGGNGAIQKFTLIMRALRHSHERYAKLQISHHSPLAKIACMRIESLAMSDLPPDPLKVMDENLRALEAKRETLEKEIEKAVEELRHLQDLAGNRSAKATEG